MDVNVLALGKRITAFLDPAIYFAHAEIELAFTTLFHTFGRGFGSRYAEIRPIVAGFLKNDVTFIISIPYWFTCAYLGVLTFLL